MKKIIYSSYTKFIALLLSVLCIALGVNTLIDTIARYDNEEIPLYSFSDSLENSPFFSSYLYDLNVSVHNAFDAFYKNQNTPDNPPLEEHIKTRLAHINDQNKINYFISINEQVFTNCSAANKTDIINNKYFSLAELYSDGTTHYDSCMRGSYWFYLDDLHQDYNITDEITVAAAIDNDYVIECEAEWANQAAYIEKAFYTLLALAITALLLIVYLIAVCGKTKTGEYNPMWLDSIFVEVHLFNIAISGGCAIVILFMLIDSYLYNQLALYVLKSITIAIILSGYLLVLTSLLSLSRMIKCKTFIKNSLILRIFKLAWKIASKFIRAVYSKIKSYFRTMKAVLFKKTGIILISALLVYTLIIGLCGIFTFEAPLFFVFAVALFLFAAFVLANRTSDLDLIKQGANEIQHGNLSYKIPSIKSEDLKPLANNINEIGTGLDKSVSAKLKAEKLKTELITNVSHDLKTPLTSIINYTELLSKIEGLPEEAKDYALIIAQKSNRLKNLTQDLFDISKVQSGNETINLENLDIALLINQSLGEHDNEIKSSDLTFCVNIAKELHILADGRKMSRVMSNLLSNILKYTMKNTRVFISAREEKGKVIIEFKNISSYPMDFDSNEIIERFVRGDDSRTVEGNGLGLAIAKSYTEACGGTFNVITDGDLFKAVIKFDKL